MNLNEMIENSRKKNEKFDSVKKADFIERQFTGALNLKASKEGTGFAGAFANWLFEMARVGCLDLMTARIIGNRMQQEALDSKHDGGGDMSQTIWFKLTQLRRFRGNEFQLREEIKQILDKNNKVSTVNVNEDLSSVLDEF